LNARQDYQELDRVYETRKTTRTMRQEHELGPVANAILDQDKTMIL
jgi:hypothetical protein